MLIAIVGTRASGKDSIHRYLVDKGFTPLALAEAEPDNLRFSTTSEMLAHVTRHWTDHFVTMDLGTRALLAPFMRRPFFMLISAAADSLHAIRDLVHLHIDNAFDTVPDLHFHLEKLDLLDPSHLRPGWDAYFMTIASLASHRSNCMKRRVGAVLVDVRGGNRIIATGYNGTPRGLTNCNAGGCPRCNTGIESVECICLHAEENALLEAGRERVGPGAVLYCNTCPCLKCTVKIIQTGVSTVVYNLSYKVDDASAALFKESGVELRRYNPNHKHYLPTIDAPGLRMVNP
ncbi:cytidine deaminase-like protein [Schizophyllum commune]